MKTTQYIKQENAIAAADSGGIRERWLYGLRLLRDSDAFAPGSSQLKPGRADELVRASKSAGRRLSEREIQYRLRCARAYPTEAQIAQASAEFGTWSALIAKDFPAYQIPDGEPLADYRTETERSRDRARTLALTIGEQATLFPLDALEPEISTLKDLLIYAEEMEGLTSRFAKRDRKRREYLESLIDAADDDMSMTWQDAHSRLGGEPL